MHAQRNAKSRMPNLFSTQVDERLNGDGTGLPFGVNDGILGWCIFGVFTTIWTVWFISQRDLVREWCCLEL